MGFNSLLIYSRLFTEGIVLTVIEALLTFTKLLVDPWQGVLGVLLEARAVSW